MLCIQNGKHSAKLELKTRETTNWCLAATPKSMPKSVWILLHNVFKFCVYIFVNHWRILNIELYANEIKQDRARKINRPKKMARVEKFKMKNHSYEMWQMQFIWVIDIYCYDWCQKTKVTGMVVSLWDFIEWRQNDARERERKKNCNENTSRNVKLERLTTLTTRDRLTHIIIKIIIIINNWLNNAMQCNAQQMLQILRAMNLIM